MKKLLLIHLSIGFALTLVILGMTVMSHRHAWMIIPIGAYTFWQVILLIWIAVEKTYDRHWFRTVDDLAAERTRWKEKADHLEKVINVIGNHEAVKIWEAAKAEKAGKEVANGNG